MASLIPASVDYTDKDFDSLRQRMINLVSTVFPDWTDFNDANFGNLLLDLFAFVGDVLTYSQDRQAGEAFLLTATQRKNVIAILKQLNERLAGAQAATADVDFTLAAPPVGDVIIPAGTIVRTQEVTDPVRFQLLADVTIPAASNPPTATGTVEDSESKDEVFTSTNATNQEFTLSFTPFLDGSAIITAGNGAYTEQENLLSSGPNDRHFTVLVDQNDRATIRFGDGLQGAVPQGSINVSYKTGGGSSGKVDAGRIVVIEGSFTDVFANPVQVSVVNPAESAGGVDRETIQSGKERGPASLRAQVRTVAREDYEINARKLPEVARALMLTSNEDVTISENAGILFVVPQGGGLPSQAIKDAALNQVTVVFPNTLTFVVAVQDPIYKVIDVTSRVFLRAGSNANTVRAAIQAALTSFFEITRPDGTSNPDVDFGFNIRDVDGQITGEVAWSDIFAVVQAVTGVRKIGDDEADFLLNGVADDVQMTIKEFPVLGTVTLLNGDTGGFL